LGSIAAIIAAGVIIRTGWTPIDPLLSMAVALLVLRSAWFITRQSAHILMEGAPQNLDPAAIGSDLLNTIEDLEDVHHIHIWCLTQERPLVTLHARIKDEADPDQMLKTISSRLLDRFQIEHVTVQIEKTACT
ncbi:MAG: cation diffusion facilitator family transporter, partial [Gammaproteobacteria bacterium]|nr:cation diffusion facilitator family transporter [Gammaproteobacteria bacterium]